MSNGPSVFDQQQQVGKSVPISSRELVLETAREYVMKNRNSQYGSPEDSFQNIADLWSAFLDVRLTTRQVAYMMVLMKIARLKHNPNHFDSIVDVAGYAACAADCAPVITDLGQVNSIHVRPNSGAASL